MPIPNLGSRKDGVFHRGYPWSNGILLFVPFRVCSICMTISRVSCVSMWVLSRSIVYRCRSATVRWLLRIKGFRDTIEIIAKKSFASIVVHYQCVNISPEDVAIEIVPRAFRTAHRVRIATSPSPFYPVLHNCENNIHTVPKNDKFSCQMLLTNLYNCSRLDDYKFCFTTFDFCGMKYNEHVSKTTFV